MSKYKTFQVTQQLSWSCPGMLIFVSAQNKILGHQTNPTNTLTQNWYEEDISLPDFSPDNYKTCVEV